SNFAGTYQPILGSPPGKRHTGPVKRTVHTVCPTTTGLPDLRENERMEITNTSMLPVILVYSVGFAGVLERVHSRNTPFFQDRPIKHPRIPARLTTAILFVGLKAACWRFTGPWRQLSSL
ncbi:hypothetical protein EDD15DRAFT_2241590, partial [Pisolithus albus]